MRYICALMAFSLFGQTPAKFDGLAKFDVATIRPSNAQGAGMNNLRDPVQATWTNMTLKWIVINAYGLRPDELAGGPAWVDSDKWDIIAKSSQPATRPQQAEMLKLLLAERFKLRVHRETRQLPQYELAIAKGGPKLHEVTAAEMAAKRAGTRIGRGLIDAHGISTQEFAGWLRSELGKPVIDRTGLAAKYDFPLRWVPDESQPNGGYESPPADSNGPTIFTAIQEQLGLKLNAIKGPVEVLVIDSAEKPVAPAGN